MKRVSLIAVAALLGMSAGQEVRDGSALQRIDWERAQLDLASRVPVWIRQIANLIPARSVDLVLAVDSLGRVGDVTLARSAGLGEFDRAARGAAASFRYAAPVVAGRYLVQVHFTPDSLVPAALRLTCPPPAAWEALFATYSPTIARGPGGAIVTEWNLTTVDPRTGEARRERVLRRLRLEFEPRGLEACAGIFASWPTAGAEAAVAHLPDFRLCGPRECDPLAVPEREYVLRVLAVRMTWPPDEWTVTIEAPFDSGEWRVTCDDADQCSVTGRPPRPLH